MTMTSNRGKIITTGVLSLAVLISSTLGASAANAATIQDGTPPAYTMTAAEQTQISSYTKYTGEVTSMSLPPAVVASWAKVGFSIDIPASIAATNAYNDATNGDFLIIVAKNDIGTFVTNSPYAANIDAATKTTNGTPSGIGFLANGGDGAANITLPQFQTLSPVQLGQVSNLYPNTGLTTNDPTTLTADSNAPAGQWTVGFIAPSSSTYEGGVSHAAAGGTDPSKTWYRDGYASNPARNADLTLDGTQRGHNAATLVNCETENVGACGVSIQPMAYGNIIGSANLESGSMVVGETGFLTVVSTRHEVMPTAKSEATAMTLASGTKVWFTPQNLAAQGLTDGNGTPNFYNLAVPLGPAPTAGSNNVFSPSLANTTVTQDVDGALSIGLETQTAFADAPISESIVPAAEPSAYTLTLTSTDPRVNGVWLNSLGTAYAVGDSSYYADQNTTMTVTSNSNGVLTFNVAVGVIITGDPTLKASNTVSTSIAGDMVTDAVGGLTYEAHYILATTPVVIPEEPDMSTTPTEPTPVIPEEPTGDSGNTPVAPPTGDSSSRPFVNIGNTSAYTHGDEQAQAVTATETGAENNGLLIANIIAVGLALMGGLVLALRKKMRMVRIEK